MSEIKLVTLSDEPALALGEFEISADGETLFVGSGLINTSGTEIIYRGKSNLKISRAKFSKLGVIKGNVQLSTSVNVKDTLSKRRSLNTIVNTTINNVNVNLMEGL